MSSMKDEHNEQPESKKDDAAEEHNTSRFDSYRRILTLVLKHHNTDFQVATSPGPLPPEGLETATLQGDPKALAEDLEKMGPTFIKLGQLLSTRFDLLPAPYIDALAKLQDDVEPFAYEEVTRIFEEEIGVRISKAFEHFDEEPLGTASLGQTHRARLRDGREVVVKIQRPHIRKTILNDLGAMDTITGLVDRHTETGRRYEFSTLLEEFRRTLLRELDYRLEAGNLRKLASNLKSYEDIIVPEPVEDFSSARVLTMTYVPGSKVTALSPLVQTEFDGRKLAETLCRAYLDQVLIDGFFHADPHPGNILVTPDRKLALLDLGMVSHVDEKNQEHLLKLLLAISEGRSHEAAELSRTMGSPIDEEYDEERFRQVISEYISAAATTADKNTNIGFVFLNLCRLSAENGIRPNAALTMLGKTLLHIDTISRALSPDMAPWQVLQSHAESLMRRHMLGEFAPSKLFSTFLETHELAQNLPRHLNMLLENLAQNRLSIDVDAIDEEKLTESIQKIANRITVGLILAALIVGAAMLMDIPTRFQLFGYPGLAVIFFLVAATGGLILVWNVLWNDVLKRDR